MADDERKLTTNITPFGLRMQPALKRLIDEAAQANNRSINAEIVNRLERSFDETWDVFTLRRRVDELQKQSEAADGSIAIHIPKDMQDRVQALVKQRGWDPSTLLGDIDMLLGSITHDQKRLQKTIDRQRLELDRLRNEKFGGRAVTAEADVLRQEREALESAKAMRAEEEQERAAKLDMLLAAITKLVEK